MTYSRELFFKWVVSFFMRFVRRSWRPNSRLSQHRGAAPCCRDEEIAETDLLSTIRARFPAGGDLNNSQAHPRLSLVDFDSPRLRLRVDRTTVVSMVWHLHMPIHHSHAYRAIKDKRYSESIGCPRSEVGDFRNAIMVAPEKGILLTTSRFSGEASGSRSQQRRVANRTSR